MLDPFYYPRTTLAQSLLSAFKENISHAFTLFAPRRMGKTQFLIKDIIPEAEKTGFRVFYFSFMDTDVNFTQALKAFADNTLNEKAQNLFHSVKSMSFFGNSVEFDKQEVNESVSQLIGRLAQEKMPILLLLDEVQELARSNGTESLVRSLRTGLDLHKDRIKVIFTGSSTNGLRAMFNDGKAPFFHFSHQINFPVLGKDFTDYLANIYEQRTNQLIDRKALYQIFEQFNFSPMYIRLVIEEMILNPDLTLSETAKSRFIQLEAQTDYRQTWQELNLLDKALLQAIAQAPIATYGKSTRERLAELIGVKEIAASSIQGSLRKLVRRDLLTKNSQGQYVINESAFKSWILRLLESN